MNVDKAINKLDEIVIDWGAHGDRIWSPRIYYQHLREILLALKEDN